MSLAGQKYKGEMRLKYYTILLSQGKQSCSWSCYCFKTSRNTSLHIIAKNHAVFLNSSRLYCVCVCVSHLYNLCHCLIRALLPLPLPFNANVKCYIRREQEKRKRKERKCMMNNQFEAKAEHTIRYIIHGSV